MYVRPRPVQPSHSMKPHYDVDDNKYCGICPLDRNPQDYSIRIHRYDLRRVIQYDANPYFLQFLTIEEIMDAMIADLHNDCQFDTKYKLRAFTFLIEGYVYLIVSSVHCPRAASRSAVSISNCPSLWLPTLKAVGRAYYGPLRSLHCPCWLYLSPLVFKRPRLSYSSPSAPSAVPSTSTMTGSSVPTCPPRPS